MSYEVVPVPIGYCIERLCPSLEGGVFYRLRYNGRFNRWSLPGMPFKCFKTLGHLRVVLKQLEALFPSDYIFKVVEIFN